MVFEPILGAIFEYLFDSPWTRLSGVSDRWSELPRAGNPETDLPSSFLPFGDLDFSFGPGAKCPKGGGHRIDSPRLRGGIPKRAYSFPSLLGCFAGVIVEFRFYIWRGQ